MIISKTPFRVSLFGGGTDYPSWYREHGGRVLGTTIDKYCYITCRYWPPFFGKMHRIVYSQIEITDSIGSIKHPSVRECLNYLNIKECLEMTHNADLPARSGLGSSSSFTVGFLNALYGLKGQLVSKYQLAKDAIKVEQELIKENVGSQDQILAAYGGFNIVEFTTKDTYIITPVTISNERRASLESHLLLFYTGISRFASDIAKDKIQNLHKKTGELKHMQHFVQEALSIISSKRDIKDIGLLMKENWQLKKSISSKISNEVIDNIYNTGIRAGAIGGKILGAGGGGFFLFFAEPEYHAGIKNALKDYIHVPFAFEDFGTQIIYYNPNLSGGK